MFVDTSHMPQAAMAGIGVEGPGQNEAGGGYSPICSGCSSPAGALPVPIDYSPLSPGAHSGDVEHEAGSATCPSSGSPSLETIGNKEEAEANGVGPALQFFAPEVLDHEAGQVVQFFVPEALEHRLEVLLEHDGDGLWSDASSGYEWGVGEDSEFDSEGGDCETDTSILKFEDTAATDGAACSSSRALHVDEPHEIDQDTVETGADAISNYQHDTSQVASDSNAMEEQAGAPDPASSLSHTGAEVTVRDNVSSQASNTTITAGAAEGVPPPPDNGEPALTDTGGHALTAQQAVAATVTAAALAVVVAAAAADVENGEGFIRNGFGIKIWRDSSKYMGDWVNGKMTGIPRYTSNLRSPTLAWVHHKG